MFFYGCGFLGGIYSKARRYVRTFSGRQRYNVLGAINFMSKKVHTVTNATYITATEICQMLKTVATEYPGKKKECEKCALRRCRRAFCPEVDFYKEEIIFGTKFVNC